MACCQHLLKHPTQLRTRRAFKQKAGKVTSSRPSMALLSCMYQASKPMASSVGHGFAAA